MRRSLCILLLPGLSAALGAKDRELTFEERVELIRGLTAEFATAKTFLPRSKKPLLLDSKGGYDSKQWQEIGREFGPAARVGDLVQITKVKLEEDRIVLEINGGMKGGRKWYERIEVGTGTRTTPISSRNYTMAPSGTTLAVVFPGRVPPLKSAEFKKLLEPVLDFNLRSATEQYVEKLPAPIQQAIKEQRAMEGMDREQVLLALGRPKHKVRETRDGFDYEDWIYGEPPGKITFVTFQGDKVVRVKEAYAGLGGSVMPPLKPPR